MRKPKFHSRSFDGDSLAAQRETCVRLYKTMLDLIPKEPNIKILDLGCGHGHILSYLRGNGRDAYGLDVNVDSLQHRNLRGYFVCGDAHNLPFRDSSLDVILAFELVEHLKEPEKALEEIRRTLKRNGILLLTSPTPKSKSANKPGHINVRRREDWVSLLKRLGFKVKIVTYKYPIRLSVPLPYCLDRLLYETLGRMMGIWKRYLDVTSTKLLCEKA
ncbi:MAG: methyltransferase domain-containing protein [Crenarchaeota archaeon]|nr:methyltransferase domain-containing protein [Thermoproteota archaeon]